MNIQDALEHQNRLEAFQHKHRTGLVTLVFTDLVDSVALRRQLGDQAGTSLLQAHRQLVRQTLARFADAEEIETAGDSFLLLFARPSDAVKFALIVQMQTRALALSGRSSRREEAPSSKPEIDQSLLTSAATNLKARIGIHVGEVVIEEHERGPKSKDVYGTQIDVCARVMGLAEGGQILLTRAVFDSARQALKGEDIAGVKELSWLNHGPYLLKGIEESVEVCEAGETGIAPLKAPAGSEKAQRQVSPDSEPVLGWRPALGQVVPNTKWVLEQKLGEGGFGEVWLGRHATMKERRVFKFCFRADRVRSLKREMTLFRLLKERVGDHPNIVRLLEVYFDEPPFYVVMDYVEGQDLKAWCEQQGGVEKVPLVARLEIVAQIADALQAAHDAGVIHRDVKPGNILISDGRFAISDFPEANPKSQIANRKSDLSQPSTLNPQPTAKLTDFGIGQVVSEEALKGMTRAGFTQTILAESSSSQTGSQMYMAPELLAGKPASTRSDIYSLGVVLYQLLVGDLTRPLTTDWSDQIFDPLLRDDLKHCFAGNPQERFEGAGQLAKNLRSLAARRAELERQQAELAARERAAYRRGMIRAAAVAVIIVAAVTALAIFAFQQARRADQNAENATATARDLRRNLYVADIKLAHLALEEHNLGRARDLLDRHRPELGVPALAGQDTLKRGHQTDLRGFEWRYLWQQSQGQETFSFRPHSNRVSCVVFSPDGKTFLTGGEDKIVKVWETSSRQQVRSLSEVTNPFESLQVAQNSPSFSPDGKLLALAGNASVVIWETANWQVKARWPNEEHADRVVFSPDGKTLATRSERGVQFWDTGTWGRRPSLESKTMPSGSALIYSNDGKFLAIGGRTGMELWDGFALTRLDQFSIRATAWSFSPGGSLLAVGDYEGNVFLWDAVKRQEVTRWKTHRSATRGLSFSLDGKILATCGDDQAIHLWELATQRRLSTLTGHKGRIWTISFSPDGQTLASASDDGTVKFWNPSPAVEEKDLKQTLTPLWFSPDARVVATIDTNLAVQYWDVASRHQIRTISPVVDPKTVNHVRMAPDGKTLAIGCTNAAIELWNLESRERIATLPNDGKQVIGGLIFSPDQRWLVSAHLTRATGQPSEGRLWNLATRQVEARFPIMESLTAFSPDGKILATIGTNRTVHLWDTATHRELRTLTIREVRTLKFASVLYALAFSPDGKLLASAGGEFVARIWEVSSGKEIAVMSGHVGAVIDLAFSPDGQTLATGSSDGTVKFWHTATWQELMTLPDYGKKVSRLMFSPDGSTLAVGSLIYDYELGPVQLWRAPSLADIDAAGQRKTE